MRDPQIYIPAHLPSRQEAVDLGLHFYGEASEVYRHPSEDPQQAAILYMLGRLRSIVTSRTEPMDGEILGTCISMIEVDTDEIVLSALVERTLYRSERSYKRHVRKAAKRKARTVNSWNRMKAFKATAS